VSSQIFTKSKAQGAPGAPEIYVAAFGKHVAWNDFIDDPGLETDRLIAIKRVLYLEGIAAAIDTGAWDKLEAAQKIEGFAHLIIWRTRTDIVACRLWSSSDGKGRTKYPMVVVAQCRGASLSWVLAEVLPRLERLERRCREATTQEQVRAALDATRAELRSRAAVAEGGTPIQTTAIAETAEAISAGGSRDPFYRLMYQIERDWGAYLARRPELASSTRTWSGGLRSQHARVPSGTGSAEAGISLWSHFVLSLVDGATSVTLIRSTDQSSSAAAWTDIIVGEPEGSQFFCIRASDQSLPLATSIPYTLEPDFKASCDRLVEDSRSGRLGSKTPEVVTNVQPGLIQRMKGLLGGKKKGMLVLLIAAGLVGAGTGIAIYFWGGGSGAGGGRTRAEAPREHPPPMPAHPAPPMTPAAEAGEWGRLCAAYHDWFAEFVQRLQKRSGETGGAGFKTRAEFYATDPYLKGLLDKLRRAQESGHGVDPWAIAGVPKSQDLAELAKSAPAKVAEPATKASIDEAMSIIDGFSVKLATDWPALKTLRDAAGSLEASGLTAEAAYLRALVAGVDPSGAGAAGGPTQGIDAVLAASGVVEQIQQRLALRDECVALTKSSGDPLLGRFDEWAVKTAGASSGGAVDLALLEGLSRSLAKVGEVAAPLVKFLKEQWSSTDVALLTKRVGETPALRVETASRESFLAWIDLAKRSPRLDAGADPRRSSAAPELLRQAEASRRRLVEEFKAAPEKRLADLSDAAERSFAELMALPFNAETQPAIAAGVPRVELQLRELKQGLENAVAVEGAKRAGSAKEVRESLAAQETIVARSEAINSAWRVGRDRLVQAIPDKDYAQLRVSTDALRAALLALDGAVEPGLPDEDADEAARAIAAASWSERERVIAGVLREWKGIEGDADGKALAAAGEKAAGEYARERSDMEASERDVATIRSQLAAGASLSDKAPGGEPLASVVERCRRSEVLKIGPVAAAVRPVMAEVESLERVESLVGAKELAGAAEAALPREWPAALAAWRRLGRLSAPAWPSSLETLRREAALSARLLEAIAGADVRGALEAEVHSQRAARWVRAFGALSDPADIDAAAAMADEMGVDPGSLAPALRYNLALAVFRRAASGASLSDGQARQRAQAFESEVRAMGESVSALPGVSQLLARLGPISGREAAPSPPVDVTRLGPGAIAGFSGKVEGAILRFRHGDGANALSLDFARVEAPGVETFFIGLTEVSLGEVIGIVDQAGAWKDLGTLFTSIDPQEDFRKGPRVWKWVDDGKGGAVMRPAEKWLRELATGRTVAETPRTIAPGSPEASHPMNYIPPSAALFISHLAGCRLPTQGEWGAAAAMDEAARELRRCNLRDAQWKAEQAYINDLGRGGSVNWPDDDVYVPASTPRARTGPDAASNPWDDGVLWFVSVDNGPAGDTEPLRHLVGNVAEYVVNASAADLLPAAGGPSVEGARAVLARRRDALKVIGASALSPLEVAPTTPQPVDLEEAAGGYADVGFRLAFSAAGAGPMAEPLGVQLSRVLGEATYIVPGKGK
jgi:hypothetical protein